MAVPSRRILIIITMWILTTWTSVDGQLSYFSGSNGRSLQLNHKNKSNSHRIVDDLTLNFYKRKTSAILEFLDELLPTITELRDNMTELLDPQFHPSPLSLDEFKQVDQTLDHDMDEIELRVESEHEIRETFSKLLNHTETHLRHFHHTFENLINGKFSRPHDCFQISKKPSKSDIYQIYPFCKNKTSIRVQCDCETDGGGWTIIQQRNSGPKDQFYLGWTDYEEGFGNATGNYWIGLKAIHALTSKTRQELRIELEDWEGVVRFAKYDSFSVGDASELYALRVGDYTGTAGDSLSFHNGSSFSTFDKDNDSSSYNIAMEYHGAWWYRDGYHSNLNGYYFMTSSAPAMDGISWFTFKNDSSYSLKSVSMKIRDASV